jgi:hypothetical protein
MQPPKREPDLSECTCGRKLADATVFVYRTRRDYCLYHRCACGAEWTEHRASVDAHEPISYDEVIEVHQRLSGYGGTLQDLFGIGSSS